jgi:hypothetical protein
MSKHTKGKWELAGNYMVIAPGGSIDGGDTIATCNPMRCDAVANARLIAVAPEMLEVLLNFIRQLSLDNKCFINPFRCNVIIGQIFFNTNELTIKILCSNAGAAAAHCEIENGFTFERVCFD